MNDINTRPVSTRPDRKMRAYQAAMVLLRGRLLTPSEAAEVWRIEPWEIELARLEIELGEHPARLEE